MSSRLLAVMQLTRLPENLEQVDRDGCTEARDACEVDGVAWRVG